MPQTGSAAQTAIFWSNSLRDGCAGGFADQFLLFLSPPSTVEANLDVSPQAVTWQAITDAFETIIHRESSVNLNQMLYALRTDYYPGFNHQAVFVDACANYLYRSQSRFVTQPHEIPKGEPAEKYQRTLSPL